jgi:hypothetical protein
LAFGDRFQAHKTTPYGLKLPFFAWRWLAWLPLMELFATAGGGICGTIYLVGLTIDNLRGHKESAAFLNSMGI